MRARKSDGSIHAVGMGNPVTCAAFMPAIALMFHFYESLAVLMPEPGK